MKKLLLLVCCAVFVASPAQGHTPLRVEVIEPSSGTVLGSTDLRITIKAVSDDPAATKTQVELKIDDKFVDPERKKLVREKPPFAAVVLGRSQTRTITVRDVPFGKHSLVLTYPPHPGETPVTESVPFSILRTARQGFMSATYFFLFVLVAMIVAAVAVQFSWRRRMSRN